MCKVRIVIEALTFAAELNNSATAQGIRASLPLESTVNVWGQEIYFDIPVYIDEAPDAVTEVDVGALAYWPMGPAFCLFFGPTPISDGPKPRAYSPVNVFGRVLDDIAPLKKVKNGATIRVERA